MLPATAVTRAAGVVLFLSVLLLAYTLPAHAPVLKPGPPPTGGDGGNGQPAIVTGRSGLPEGERAEDWEPPPPPPPKDDNRPVAYLTFDDGPSSLTPQVLDILRRYDAVATFFVVGNPTPSGHLMYQRIVAEGHAIGNHTYSHQFHQIYRSADAFMEDFMRMHRLLEATTGQTPNIMRYPGGSLNGIATREVMAEIIRRVRAAGYVHFDWNVDSGDARFADPDVAGIIDRVLTQAPAWGGRSAVILMHDSMTRTATVEALPAILEGLIKMGYRFEVLSPEAPLVQHRR